MKKILLLLALVLSGLSEAQTLAVQPPSLSQCGNEVFNLNIQTPIILGEQDPQYFYVTYYMSGFDAETESNPIQQPASFVSLPSQVIFARVDSLTDDTYAITQFNLEWGSATVQQLPDAMACNTWSVPALTVGEIRTAPAGGGFVIPPGTTITSTQTLYIYNQFGACSAESSFTVTVVHPEPFSPMYDIVSCGPYTLPDLPAGLNYSLNGQYLPPGWVISQNAVVGVVAPFPCGFLQEFTVLITGPSGTVNAPPLVTCALEGSAIGIFDLTSTIPFFSAGYPSATISFHQSEADALTGQNPIENSAFFPSMPTGFQVVFVRTVIPTVNGTCVTVNTQALIVEQCNPTTLTVSLHADYEGTGCTSSSSPVGGAVVTVVAGNVAYYGISGQDGTVSFSNLPTGPVTIMAPDALAGLVLSGEGTYTTVLNPMQNPNYQFDFCYTPVTSVNDVQVSLYPLGNARPGFPAYYAIILSNVGNVTSSGTVTVQFDSTRLSFSSADQAPIAQTGDTVTFSYTNLAPWQNSYVWMTFLVAPPPTANIGDALQFTATVTPNQPDNNLGNNSISFAQPVVNSFDPNDIAVLEGAVISQEQADDWLHYIVRFENTGTAEAVNVRVENALSDLLDWSTFAVEGASHPVQTTRQNNVVTFRFDAIDLPATSQNAVASHGWIAYRVKPGSNFIQGTTIENDAAIFFDFNAPVQTDTVTTELAPLSVHTPTGTAFTLYPNPASTLVRIASVDVRSRVVVYDMSGRRLPLPSVREGNETILDVSSLPPGVYAVHISSDTGNAVCKLLKR